MTVGRVRYPITVCVCEVCGRIMRSRTSLCDMRPKCAFNGCVGVNLRPLCRPRLFEADGYIRNCGRARLLQHPPLYLSLSLFVFFVCNVACGRLPTGSWSSRSPQCKTYSAHYACASSVSHCPNSFKMGRKLPMLVDRPTAGEFVRADVLFSPHDLDECRIDER